VGAGHAARPGAGSMSLPQPAITVIFAHSHDWQILNPAVILRDELLMRCAVCGDLAIRARP
jgi:hypothetical protein